MNEGGRGGILLGSGRLGHEGIGDPHQKISIAKPGTLHVLLKITTIQVIGGLSTVVTRLPTISPINATVRVCACPYHIRLYNQALRELYTRRHST